MVPGGPRSKSLAKALILIEIKQEIGNNEIGKFCLYESVQRKSEKAQGKGDQQKFSFELCGDITSLLPTVSQLGPIKAEFPISERAVSPFRGADQSTREKEIGKQIPTWK
jgi:hypothetical protein